MEKINSPKHLKPATLKWWRDVIENWTLEAHHMKILTAAAVEWDRLCEADEAIRKLGMTYQDRFGQPQARPELKISRDSKNLFARLVRELGLDVMPEPPRPPVVQGRSNR